MPWKDKMPHLELYWALRIMKRCFLSHLFSFLHGVRIGGILNNNRQHRKSDPVTVLYAYVVLCFPVDNLLTAHIRMQCLTASHSSASHTDIMDGLLLSFAMLC